VTVSVRSSGDHFFADDRFARSECLIWCLPFATFFLVLSLLVVPDEARIEIILHVYQVVLDVLNGDQSLETPMTADVKLKGVSGSGRRRGT